MSFSAQSWTRIEGLYGQILALPFNQELAAGTLSRERFIFGPKWPIRSDAWIAPSRGSVITASTGQELAQETESTTLKKRAR